MKSRCRSLKSIGKEQREREREELVFWKELKLPLWKGGEMEIAREHRKRDNNVM